MRSPWRSSNCFFHDAGGIPRRRSAACSLVCFWSLKFLSTSFNQHPAHLLYQTSVIFAVPPTPSTTHSFVVTPSEVAWPSSPNYLPMTLDHARHPRSIRDIRDDQTPFLQALPQPRELGGTIPLKQPDGAPIAAAASPFAKSWAHFIAGGSVILSAAYGGERIGS